MERSEMRGRRSRIALRSIRATDGALSISRLPVAERRDGLPLRRRIDVEIDHADAALLEDGDALFQRRLHIGGPGHRTDAGRALRLAQLGDVGRGIFPTQPPPAVL